MMIFAEIKYPVSLEMILVNYTLIEPLYIVISQNIYIFTFSFKP